MIRSLASLFRKFTVCADRTSGKISVTEKINRNYTINWNNSQYAPVTLKYHGKKVCSVIPRVFSELLYINLLTLASFCIFLSFLQQSLQSSLYCWQRKISHKICTWKDIFSMLPTKKIVVSTIKNITQINCFVSPYSFYKSGEKQAKTIKTLLGPSVCSAFPKLVFHHLSHDATNRPFQTWYFGCILQNTHTTWELRINFSRFLFNCSLFWTTCRKLQFWEPLV